MNSGQWASARRGSRQGSRYIAWAERSEPCQWASRRHRCDRRRWLRRDQHAERPRRADVVAVTGKAEATTATLRSLGAKQVLLRQEIVIGSRPLEAARWAGAIDSVGGEILSWLTVRWVPRATSRRVGLVGGVEFRTTVMPFILRGVNLLGINSSATPPNCASRCGSASAVTPAATRSAAHRDTHRQLRRTAGSVRGLPQGQGCQPNGGRDRITSYNNGPVFRDTGAVPGSLKGRRG